MVVIRRLYPEGLEKLTATLHTKNEAKIFSGPILKHVNGGN